MPKLKNRPPKLSKEKGYAVVYCNGTRVSMGRWGSPEADKNYHRFLAEWSMNVQTSTVRPGSRVSVAELVAAYLDYAEKNLDPCDYRHHRVISQEILELYADTPVDEFGPKALAAVQCRLEASGRARGYCNKLINFIRAQFRWGVAQELVDASKVAALKCVPPLKEGHTTAPETPPREDVPDEVVAQTLKYLLPTIAAMVLVQRYASMRPSEVCRMRVCDIDRSGEIWLYMPPKHKGTWRGHGKIIPLGKPEQDLIAPRLEGKTQNEYVFTPQETIRESKERKAENIVFPQQTRKKKNGQKNEVRDHYVSETYARNLKRSLEVANRSLPKSEQIPYWTPYQLRHAAISEITFEHGGDMNVARAVAGQKSIKVTQRYNHADVKIAIEQAKKRKPKFGKKADKKSSSSRESEGDATVKGD